jgi:putative transcriptional regulator
MPSSLAPGFLLASPPVGDPNFDRTVVLLAVHGSAGALGFVVNRRADVTIGATLRLANHEVARECTACPVHIGGPVQPNSGWVLGEGLGLEEASQVIRVGARLELSSSRQAFADIARDLDALGPNELDPKRRVVFLGYSGWGPGQLEEEIARGTWLPSPLNESLLLEVELEHRWERAYALHGLNPANLMSMRNVGLA